MRLIDAAQAVKRSYPMPEVGAMAERSNPTSKEQWLRGCRRAIPGSKSGGEAMRRYTSSKIRSSGCALVEQP